MFFCFFSFDSKNLIFLFFSLLEKKTTTTTTIQESCHQHLQINHYHYHHHQKIVHQINSVVIMEIVYRNVGFVVCFFLSSMWWLLLLMVRIFCFFYKSIKSRFSKRLWRWWRWESILSTTTMWSKSIHLWSICIQ